MIKIASKTQEKMAELLRCFTDKEIMVEHDSQIVDFVFTGVLEESDTNCFTVVADNNSIRFTNISIEGISYDSIRCIVYLRDN